MSSHPTAGGEWYGWCKWYDVVCKGKEAVKTVTKTVTSAAQSVANNPNVKAATTWAVENRDKIAIGAAIGVAVVATVATGGAAAPLLVGAIAAGAAVTTTVAINAADKHVLGNQERGYLDGAVENGATGFVVGAGVGLAGNAVAATVATIKIVTTVAGALSADGDPTNEIKTATNAVQQANQACGGDYCASEVGDAAQKLGNTVSGQYKVYQGVDTNGTIRYVGITMRDAAVRFAEHAKSIGTGKESLDYRVVVDGLTQLEARILEQTYINQYGMMKNGSLLLNRINSIAEKYWSIYGIPPCK